MLTPVLAVAALAQPAPGSAPRSAALWPEIVGPKAAAELSKRTERRLATASVRLAKATGQPASRLRTALEGRIALNLVDKLAKSGASADAATFVLSPEAAAKTVVDYEIFKAETFVRAGVFPKRYFGYFDERWDTAARETEMRRLLVTGVPAANRMLAARGARIRITEAEVAVTFIAEGGALILADAAGLKRPIHPVMDVGLDDIAVGFEREQALVRALDRAWGTRIADLVNYAGPAPRLTRGMTFAEALAGTLVMWVYEKERAARLLWSKEKRRLDRLDARDQFIFSSLVYNSGLIFSSRRVAMIRTLSTGAYLYRVSEKNAQKRWRLPVRPPRDAAALLLATSGYPTQPTSWSAVYHVLQRYGGYEALMRFTEVFDDQGRYRRR